VRNVILVAVALLVSAGIILFVWWQWEHYGVISEKEKIVFEEPAGESQMPSIYAVNRRVKQGEQVSLKSMARAVDADGSDLSSQLECYGADGRRLTGNIDTKVPGQYVLTWRVKSICNGKRVQKKMIVLVDGRVRSGT
jgi:hypothetical protein